MEPTQVINKAQSKLVSALRDYREHFTIILALGTCFGIAAVLVFIATLAYLTAVDFHNNLCMGHEGHAKPIDGQTVARP
jgi:hypothetical protein